MIDPAFNASPDMAMLIRKWKLAHASFRGLPPFEEIALGNLGNLSDHVALLRVEADGGFRFLRAGRSFETWLEQPTRDLLVGDARPDLVRGLEAVFKEALKTSRPAHALIHGVKGGVLGSFDIIALPLASRWGAPMLLAWVGDRDVQFNLVDAMFAATSEGIVALSAKRDPNGRAVDFRIIAVNEGAARLMRKPAGELRWSLLSELFLSVRSTGVLERLSGILDRGTSEQFEVDYPLPEGGALHLQLNASAMGDLLAVTLTDVAPLRAREDFFRSLFDSNPVPMWIFDPVDLRFLSVNNATVDHYGYSRDTFLTMNLLDIRPVEDQARLLEAMTNGAQIEEIEGLWRHLRSDGSLIEVLSYARRITFEGRPARLVAVIDVTERRRAEARISHMAHHDALTDLPNRVLFRDRLDREIKRLQRSTSSLAVHCLDLDFFKNVNDTLGHPVGDALLKQVADRLRTSVREADVVARLGGDEFAVIQTGLTSPDEASRLAERLVEVIGRPYEVDGHQVVIGASIGIAMTPGDGDKPDDLLKNADLALYRAKDEGKRTFRFFEHEMDARARSRRALELDLRKALAAGEFELFFQPLVDSSTQRVTAFEALVRWNHPTRGRVSPADFIPLAEEIGVIVPLGDWVIRQACMEAARWSEPVCVAVNLSSVQFKSGQVLHSVVQALASSELAPERLELEITESVLLQESEANIEVLFRRRKLGVRIALDDFGTGYSSLSYLRAFPFDKIKIDKSFVQHLEDRDDCRAIVKAVINLGQSLGVRTTAEGVETQEQLDHLQRIGCTEIQGYLFSPPRPAEEAERVLADLHGKDVNKRIVVNCGGS